MFHSNPMHVLPLSSWSLFYCKVSSWILSAFLHFSICGVMMVILWDPLGPRHSTVFDGYSCVQVFAPSNIRRHRGCGHFSAQIRHVRPLSAPCFCIQSIEAKGETFPFHQHPCYHSACSQVIRQTGIHSQQMRYTSHGLPTMQQILAGPEGIPGGPKHTSQG